MGIESIRYSLVLELPHDFRQLFRHRQSNPSGVFDDGDAFVGAIEKDDSRAKDAAASYHMDIKDICHANQGENKDLLADSLEANGRGQVSFHDGAEDSRHIKPVTMKAKSAYIRLSKLPRYSPRAAPAPADQNLMSKIVSINSSSLLLFPRLYILQRTKPPIVWFHIKRCQFSVLCQIQPIVLDGYDVFVAA